MPTALLSVYHKNGITEFAQELVSMGWNLLASGGTARHLAAADVPVRDVAELVGGDAILGHRVVTLSREVHAGLMADIADPAQMAEMEELGLPIIDLVCCDLYPLEQEIAKPDSTLESVIDKTDVGGPSMIHSGAKGRRIVICTPNDRSLVIRWLKGGMPDGEKFVNDLCAKAELVCAHYLLTSAKYHSGGDIDGFIGAKVTDCKYGENAHQAPASLFTLGHDDSLGLDQLELVTGTDPSYNSFCDIDSLLQTATHIAAGFDANNFAVPNFAVGVKHGNACGASFGNDLFKITQDTVLGDPQAIFGGWIICNFTIDDKIAEILVSYGLAPGVKRRILDGIIAPRFTAVAKSILRRKKDKCRLISLPALADLNKDSLDTATRFRYVRNGFLLQPNYTYVVDFADPELQIYGELPEGAEEMLIFAKAICDTSNSNTITLAHEEHLIGNGTGQQDRVGAANLAILKATNSSHDLVGAVAVSDSFFPFPDGPQALIDAGIKVIFATSGSIRDKNIIKVCMDAGICLVMLPDKKARGFYKH